MIKKLLKFYKNVIQFLPLPSLMIFITPFRVKGLPIAQGIPPLPKQDELLELILAQFDYEPRPQDVKLACTSALTTEPNWTFKIKKYNLTRLFIWYI